MAGRAGDRAGEDAAPRADGMERTGADLPPEVPVAAILARASSRRWKRVFPPSSREMRSRRFDLGQNTGVHCGSNRLVSVQPAVY